VKAKLVCIGVCIAAAMVAALVLFTHETETPCIDCEPIIVQCEHRNPKICDALTRGMAQLNLRTATDEEEMQEGVPTLKVGDFKELLTYFTMSWTEEGKFSTIWAGIDDLAENTDDFAEFMASRIRKVRGQGGQW
jgi:hypothetical protein